METELLKENIITSYPSSNINLNIIAEGEAIVPDSKKDISEIICVEGRSVIEKTEIQSGRVIFTGTAEFTVLYKPDSEDAISSLSVKLPFNHIAECESVLPDDKYTLHHETVHSDCTLLNSRKISIKSVISVNFISYTDIYIPAVSEIKAPDMESKTEEIAFSRIISSISEQFTVSDFLERPSNALPTESELLCHPYISDYSIKNVTGKAVIKGVLSVFRLYKTPESLISHIQHDIPFTEIIDIPSSDENSLCDLSFSVKSYSLTSDDSSSDGTLAFSADIALSAIAFSTEKYLIVTDAYVPGMNVTLSSSSSKKSEICQKTSPVLTLKENIVIPPDTPSIYQLCPVFARITEVSASSDNGKITVTGTIDAVITYLSSEGKSVSSYIREIKFRHEEASVLSNPEILVKANITHTDYNLLNNSELDLRCLLSLDITVLNNNKSFSYISAVNLGESNLPQRPSIIIYFVKSGDSLWDIAKKYHTTVDKIVTANTLEKDDILNVGMRLLIPS